MKDSGKLVDLSVIALELAVSYSNPASHEDFMYQDPGFTARTQGLEKCNSAAPERSEKRIV